MKPGILLIGGGGHCRACIDVIEQEDKYKIIGIVDVKEKKGQMILGYEVIGSDCDLSEFVKICSNCLITIGQIKNAEKRRSLDVTLSEMGWRFPSIISPRAYVSHNALVGEGTIVLHNASVNASARIGRNCIINTSSVVEHDVVIEDFCHISTGAVINGGVTVGENTFIGSNSAIRETLEIGKNSFIGFGLRVKNSLPDNSIIVKTENG